MPTSVASARRVACAASSSPGTARRIACIAAVSLGVVIGIAAADRALADETPVPLRSVRDGIFTEAQARRGEAVYTGPCSRCHGPKLDGAPEDPDMYPTPPVGGSKFLRNWAGRSLAALFEYTRATMPDNNPSYLSDEEYAEVIAFMLAMSGLPAGDEALAADPGMLADVVIEPAIGVSADAKDAR